MQHDRHLPKHGQIYWPPKLGNLQDQGELDWAGGTTVCQSCPKNLAQRFEILPSSVPFRIP